MSGVEVFLSSVEDRLKSSFADAEVFVKNVKCCHGIHISVEVTSPLFNSMKMLERHRTVYDALDGLMAKIHAIELKTNSKEV